MTATHNLQVGDVFEVKNGMRILVSIPEMFVYSNRRKSSTLTKTVITVGDVYDNEGRKKFKTASFIGTYIVTDTKFDGGSTGHDPYPDGHHVFAKRLNKDGEYDAEGEEISFYQSGCFRHLVMPHETPVLRTLKKTVTVTFS